MAGEVGKHTMHMNNLSHMDRDLNCAIGLGGKRLVTGQHTQEDNRLWMGLEALCWTFKDAAARIYISFNPFEPLADVGSLRISILILMA